MTDTVTDNTDRQQFEMLLDGGLAFVAYRRTGDVLNLHHAEVPPALEGSGLGGRLVKAVLDEIRARGLKVVPGCSFVRAYMKGHPEYDDLRAG